MPSKRLMIPNATEREMQTVCIKLFLNYSERRQVTVLYCELNLSAIDDPDEAMERLSRPKPVARKSSGSFQDISCKPMAADCWLISVIRKRVKMLPDRAVQAALAVTRKQPRH